MFYVIEISNEFKFQVLLKSLDLIHLTNSPKFKQINQYTNQDEQQKHDLLTYIIIGFKKTIIIIEKSSFSILHPLLSSNPNIKIYFLSKINDININFNNKSKIIDSEDQIFKKEISNFNEELFLSNSSDEKIKKIWRYISPCISGYLIKEGYEKTNINRLDNFINFEKNSETTSKFFESNSIPIIKEDEFIEHRQIGSGTVFLVYLIYHIEREELYALKKSLLNDSEIKKLRDREIGYFMKVQHPFLPKLIGVGENKEYLIIEFINGRTLSDINELQFTFSEKITVFYEIIIIIEYLHRKQFIYRDLKPNNIMIDNNKTIVLIDFDRMIEYDCSLNTSTKDFMSSYCAPEVNQIDFSFECDIYSLAYLYLHIMNKCLDDFLNSNECERIKLIIKDSTNEDPTKRSSIAAANQNNACAQLSLGFLYRQVDLIPRDMKKSIYYFTLAANQNDSEAQLCLGMLYEQGDLIPRDMEKSIYYYSLAANQNDSNAQCNLGLLYKKGDLIPRDIKKSIHYFTLAANQNHSTAQFNLVILYARDDLIPQDINKSIHYFTLAANQNHADAQYSLALIYLSRKYIKKAIEYITISANNNCIFSLFVLALFNIKWLYIKINLDKGIEYMIKCTSHGSTLSIYANFLVGYFYHIGLYVQQDIKKAIKFYKEASSFNYSYAKNNLGIIYKHGIEKEIKKELGWSIEYFNEAIKHDNNPISMYNLAHLYFYEKPIDNSIQESIKLLIKSSNFNYYPSTFLLCIISIYEFGNDINNIIHELNKFDHFSIKLTYSICKIIYYNKLNQESVLKEKYNQYRNIDYIFDFDYFYAKCLKGIYFLDNGIQIKEENIGENINSEFYEGFDSIIKESHYK